MRSETPSATSRGLLLAGQHNHHMMLKVACSKDQNRLVSKRVARQTNKSRDAIAPAINKGRPNHDYDHCRKFRKGVGGQRGLARRNPSKTRDLGLFSVPFFLCALRRMGTHFWRTFWALFGGLFVANPPPANPFSKPLTLWSSSRGAPFFFLGYPRMTHQMPLLHSGTQRNHKDFSSDVSSNAILVWHQMQNFFGRLWSWLCLGRPWINSATFLAGHGEIHPPHGRPADQPTTRRSTWISCMIFF